VGFIRIARNHAGKNSAFMFRVQQKKLCNNY